MFPAAHWSAGQCSLQGVWSLWLYNLCNTLKSTVQKPNRWWAVCIQAWWSSLHYSFSRFLKRQITFCFLSGLFSEKDTPPLHYYLHQEGHRAKVGAMQRNSMCPTTRMWALSFKKTFPLLLLFIAAVWLRSQEPQSCSPPLSMKSK